MSGTLPRPGPEPAQWRQDETRPEHPVSPHSPSGAPVLSQWSRGRVATAMFGVLLVLIGLAPLVAGSGLLWINLTQRHDGYLTVARSDGRTAGYALASDRVTLWGSGHLWFQASLLGDVRVTATPVDPAASLFIGIAPAADAESYLRGAHYSTLSHLAGGGSAVVEHPGSALATVPAHATSWTVAATGTGTQTLLWPSRDGTWMLVVTNATGTPGVAAHIEVAATAPALAWIGASLLGAGLLMLVCGTLLISRTMLRVAQHGGTP